MSPAFRTVSLAIRWVRWARLCCFCSRSALFLLSLYGLIETRTSWSFRFLFTESLEYCAPGGATWLAWILKYFFFSASGTSRLVGENMGSLKPSLVLYVRHWQNKDKFRTTYRNRSPECLGSFRLNHCLTSRSQSCMWDEIFHCRCVDVGDVKLLSHFVALGRNTMIS